MAKIPWGLFWMKMMMKTARQSWPARPGPALQKLVGTGRAQRRVHRAGRLPHAAQYHHQERSQRCSPGPGPAHVAPWLQCAAGRPAMPAERKVGIDPCRVHAHARGNGPVCVTPRTKQTQARAAEQERPRRQHRQAKPTMTMRFQGGCRLSMSSTPPLIHEPGFPPTFCAKQLRTSCCSTRLMPKVAKQVSSGRPLQKSG